MISKPVYRMSSVGRCSRALCAARLQLESIPVPDWLETAANEGKKHEQWIKEELRADDIAVYAEQEEVKIEFPEFVLLGHIDGIINNHGREQLLEVKSMSHFEFDRWMKEGFEGFPSYSAQIACYMAGLQHLNEVQYIVKNRSSGFVDKTTIERQYLPASFQEIVAKLLNIEKSATAGELCKAEFYSPDIIECKRCVYKKLCIPSVDDSTFVPEAILLDACTDWRKAKELEEEAKSLKDEATKVFMSQTNASGFKKWLFNDLSISKIEVKENVIYPKQKLLQVFSEEELAPAKEVKAAYSYLRIDDLRKSLAE